MRKGTLVVWLLAVAPVSAQESGWRAIPGQVEELYRKQDYAGARHVIAGAPRQRGDFADLERTGTLLWLQARTDHLLGDFEAARRNYRAAISALERAGSPAALRLARVQLDYATLADLNGESRDAERRRRLALEIFEREYGPDHPVPLIAKAELAISHLGRNDYARAEAACRQVIDTWDRLGHPPSAHFAKTFDTLGQVLLETNRSAEALGAFQRSLALTESLFGPDHPVRLDAWLGLAVGHAARREFVEADIVLRQADQMARHALTPEHPMRTRIMMARYKVLRAQGRTQEAKRIEKELRVLAKSNASRRLTVSWSALAPPPK